MPSELDFSKKVPHPNVHRSHNLSLKSYDIRVCIPLLWLLSNKVKSRNSIICRKVLTNNNDYRS